MPKFECELSVHAFKKIKERRHSGNTTPAQEREDEEWLYEYARHVIDDLNLDITNDSRTYFDWHEGGEYFGQPSLKELGEYLSIGQTMDVYAGHYSTRRSYIMTATEGNGLCSKCGGKGCDDWAGEDCPSDDTELMEISSFSPRQP